MWSSWQQHQLSGRRRGMNRRAVFLDRDAELVWAFVGRGAESVVGLRGPGSGGVGHHDGC